MILSAFGMHDWMHCILTYIHSLQLMSEEIQFRYQPMWIADMETQCHFYHAMHFTAKHGIAIEVVVPSVMVDQNHIGRQSWKLIARPLSLTPSFFIAQRPSIYSQGNMGKFWGD